MITIVSPTKTQILSGVVNESTTPDFLNVSGKILETLNNLSIFEIQERFKVSSKIANEVYSFYQNFKLDTTAIYSYTGISFKNMQANEWNTEDLNFANHNLRILSALYGVLKPLDTISRYRLDFNTQLNIDLYDLWKPLITEYFNNRSEPVLSLASKEFELMIDFSNLRVPFIKVDFYEYTDNKYVNKATYSKIARGKLTNLIIKGKIDSIEKLKEITFDNYIYNTSLSDEKNIVFTRNK